MKKVLFKNLNYLLEVEKPIYSLSIEDPLVYRDIGYNIIENIIYSENNKIYELDKYALIIYDCFHLNINEKKLITALYKRLENSIDDEALKFINEIEQNCFKLFDQLSYNSDISIDYSDTTEISKYFSIYNVSFPIVEKTNYLEIIVDYFKLYSEFLKTRIIICFGLLSILAEEEIKLLEKELEYLEVVLIDINYIPNKSSRSDLLVDSDWCII